jgi:hypothetical protein
VGRIQVAEIKEGLLQLRQAMVVEIGGRVIPIEQLMQAKVRVKGSDKFIDLAAATEEQLGRIDALQLPAQSKPKGVPETDFLPADAPDYASGPRVDLTLSTAAARETPIPVTTAEELQTLRQFTYTHYYPVSVGPNISYDMNIYATGKGQSPYAGPAAKLNFSQINSGPQLEAPLVMPGRSIEQLIQIVKTRDRDQLRGFLGNAGLTDARKIDEILGYFYSQATEDNFQKDIAARKKDLEEQKGKVQERLDALVAAGEADKKDLAAQLKLELRSLQEEIGQFDNPEYLSATFGRWATRK